MTCPYQSIGFCAGLTQAEREHLCGKHCHLRRYGKGQRMNYRYWENTFGILQEGLMVFGEFDEQGKFSALQMAGKGTLISPGQLMEIWSEPYADSEVLCLQPCKVVVLDTEAVRMLYDRDIDFVKLVMGSLYTCSMENYTALKMIGGRSTYEAVRYILEWCRRKGTTGLTHEMIAVLCNRSRPSVTIAMHDILKNEPELLCAEQKTE